MSREFVRLAIFIEVTSARSTGATVAPAAGGLLLEGLTVGNNAYRTKSRTARAKFRARRETRRQLFPLGSVVATPGALDTMQEAGVAPLDLLSRHTAGDWGEVGDVDRLANEKAVRAGLRILSVYQVGPEGAREKLWIITEADRSSTCILRPDEY